MPNLSGESNDFTSDRSDRLSKMLLFHRPILLSFPKSGRTWIRVMLDRLKVRVKYLHGDGVGYIPNIPTMPFESLTFDTALLRRRVVFLHRDPRDTAVSGFFQVKFREVGYSRSVSEFVRDPCNGLEKICKYNLRWRDLGEGRPNFRMVSYEQLRLNTNDQLTAILSFFKAKRDPTSVEEVVQASSFQEMRKAEATNGFANAYGAVLSPSDPSNPESFKVRKGKVGGFVDYLTREDVEYCDGVLRELDYFARMGVATTHPATV